MNYKKIFFIFMFFLFTKQVYAMDNSTVQALAQKFMKYCDIVIKQNKNFTKNIIAQTDLSSSPPTFDINLFQQHKINKFEQAKNKIVDALNNTQEFLLASLKHVIVINIGNIVTMLEIQDILLTPTEKQLIKTL